MTIELSKRTTAGPDSVTAPKLAVVMPALNEEHTVGAVVGAVPRRIIGIGEVEVIVVDDGSTDATRDVALAAGADRIIAHRRNRGLVACFNHGIAMALARGEHCGCGKCHEMKTLQAPLHDVLPFSLWRISGCDPYRSRRRAY